MSRDLRKVWKNTTLRWDFLVFRKSSSIPRVWIRVSKHGCYDYFTLRLLFWHMWLPFTLLRLFHITIVILAYVITLYAATTISHYDCHSGICDCLLRRYDYFTLRLSFWHMWLPFTLLRLFHITIDILAYVITLYATATISHYDCHSGVCDYFTLRLSFWRMWLTYVNDIHQNENCKWKSERVNGLFYASSCMIIMHVFKELNSECFGYAHVIASLIVYKKTFLDCDWLTPVPLILFKK